MKKQDQVKRILEEIRKGHPLTLQVEFFGGDPVTVSWKGRNYWYPTDTGETRIFARDLRRAVAMWLAQQQRREDASAERGAAEADSSTQ